MNVIDAVISGAQETIKFLRYAVNVNRHIGIQRG